MIFPMVVPMLTQRSSKQKTTVHKRIQVDEQQADALESDDELAAEKSKRKVRTNQKNLTHSGTQVNQRDHSGYCWLCKRAPIESDVKHKRMATMTFKQEAGLSKDANYDPSDVSSRTPLLSPKSTNIMKEGGQMQSLQSGELQEKLEDSWQQIEDLKANLQAVVSERNLSNKELELYRSKDTNDALAKSGQQLRLLGQENAQLKTKNRDLEVQIKHVFDASKLLEGRLKEQEDAFHQRLKDANAREEDIRQQKCLLVKRVAELKALLKEKDGRGVHTEKQHTEESGSFSEETSLFSGEKSEETQVQEEREVRVHLCDF